MDRVEGQNMLPDPYRFWLLKPLLLGRVPGRRGGRGRWALNGPAFSPLPILTPAGRAPKLPSPAGPVSFPEKEELLGLCQAFPVVPE